MNKEIVLIDTDIGGDLDDVLALAFAARSPELELVGVTTVAEDADKKARLAKYLLRLLGRGEVPVYEGMSSMLVSKFDTRGLSNNHYSESMANETYETDMHAVEFMAQQIALRPGMLTLICIGNLTNIAVLLRKYPQCAAQLKQIVLMGGDYYGYRSEWNIYGDPEAAKIVFESGVPLKAIGLDVTLQCQIPCDRFAGEEIGSTPLGALLQKWVVNFREAFQTDLVTLHDPLTVCAVLSGYEHILSFKEEQVYIETQGKYTRGRTVIRQHFMGGNYREYPAGGGTAQVAYAVDVPQFADLFMRRVFN